MTETTTTKPNDVDLQVHALNEVNRVLSAEVYNLFPQLEKYIGKKLFTADGSLTKKTPITLLKTVPNALPGGYAMLNYIHISGTDTGLWLKVSVCLNGGSYDIKPNTAYCNYTDRDICIGNMENGIFMGTDQNTLDSYKIGVVYDAEDIRLKIATYRLKKAQLETLKRSIPVKFYE